MKKITVYWTAQYQTDIDVHDWVSSDSKEAQDAARRINVDFSPGARYVDGTFNILSIKEKHPTIKLGDNLEAKVYPSTNLITLINTDTNEPIANLTRSNLVKLQEAMGVEPTKEKEIIVEFYYPDRSNGSRKLFRKVQLTSLYSFDVPYLEGFELERDYKKQPEKSFKRYRMSEVENLCFVSIK